MAAWSIQNSEGTQARVEADDWLEALHIGLPAIFAPEFTHGMRAGVEIDSSGEVRFRAEDHRIELTLKRDSPAQDTPRHGTGTTNRPIIVDDVPYSHAGGPRLETIFGCTGVDEFATAELKSVEPPHAPICMEEYAPVDLEADIRNAHARFEGSRARTGMEVSEAAVSWFGELVHTDAVGVRSEQYDVDGWLFRAGSTRSFANSARAIRLRRFVRTTGIALTIRDDEADVAGMLTPLPNSDMPVYDLEKGILESWRRGGRYHGWQQEIAMQIATVMCERLSTPPRGAAKAM